MLGEQAIIPNFTSYPTPAPNPNPIPSYTDAAQHPISHGFDGLQDRSAFELAGAADSFTGTADSTAYAYGHVGVTMSETANNALITTMQPESFLPFYCEVCNISCNAKDMLEKHKKGKKHIKSVQKLTDSSAIAPNTVPPPVASEAVVTETENKMHKLLQNGASPETLFYCDICNVICNNQEGFQKHVASKKHSAKSIVQLASTNGAFDATSDPSGSSQKTLNLFQCEICKITCTSNDHLNMHMSGKKHLKKLQDLGQIPNIPLTPVASQDTLPTTQQSDEGKNVNSHKGKLVCELCGITCDTDEVFKIHLTGKKHLKKLKDSGKIPNLPLTTIDSEDAPLTNPESSEGKTVILQESKAVCELCGITCDTPEMLKIHVGGRKHQKNFEKSEKMIGPSPAPSTELVSEPKVIEPMQEEGNSVNLDGNTDLVAEPKVIGPVQEEGKSVIADGNTDPVAEPMVIGPMQEEGKSVISDGNKRKKKRGGIDDDVEAKKQKVLQSGAASDAVQTCTLCNVVCNSPTVFNSHLTGQKHAAMAVKQAETQATETFQES